VQQTSDKERVGICSEIFFVGKLLRIPYRTVVLSAKKLFGGGKNTVLQKGAAKIIKKFVILSGYAP